MYVNDFSKIIYVFYNIYYFYNMSINGNWNYYEANINSGVALAFRIE